jgi:hypothetical protein
MRNSLKTLLVASFLTAGACGGGSEGKNLGAFVGVWTPTSGNIMYACAGQSVTAPSTALTWAVGTSSDLIQTAPGSSCVMHADISSDTATETGTQTCVIPSVDSYGDSITDSLSFTAYTFVLGTDGKTATENFSGTVLETDNTVGTSTTCTMSETGASYQKQ